MKFFSIIIIILTLGFFVKACNKSDDIRMNTYAPHPADESIQKARKDLAASLVKRDQRIKSGDTLAMRYQKLREFLPLSIKGFNMEEVEGQTARTDSYSISTVSRRYIKPVGDEEEPSYIEIQLVDYNQATQVFTGLTIWSTGVNIETDERFEKTFNTDIDNVIAYEAYDKTSNKAEVTYGIAWRFILHIEANNQLGTDFVKRVARSMRLGELSGL